MRDITNFTLLGLVLVAGLDGADRGFSPSIEFQADVRGGAHHVLTLEVAADCRTFVNGPNRADVSFGSGKIFPAGTLRSGTANNDPTQAVNGIAAIGDWTTRGQNAFPFPADIAASYSSTPSFFATQYYILDGGRSALTVEGYAYFQGETPVEAQFSVTGGIGRFRGAAGDLQGGSALGTNCHWLPEFPRAVQLCAWLCAWGCGALDFAHQWWSRPFACPTHARRSLLLQMMFVFVRCGSRCQPNLLASALLIQSPELVSALSMSMSAHR